MLPASLAFDVQLGTFILVQFAFYVVTRKYPLRGYILGVLTHTTAWDRHWGGDITLA